MAAGQDVSGAIASVVKNRENISYRQLTAVDARGMTAHFTGANFLGTHAVSVAADCVAAGNLLSSKSVVKAISDGFGVDPSAHLAERLLQAIEAGVSAGGKEGPVHSAALLVGDKMPFPLVDLWVDWNETDPIAALRRLWLNYAPQMDDYLNRAVNPQVAPSYGVAGDL